MMENDPLDEIFVEKVELNLTTAKMMIKQKDIEIKKLKSQNQKTKFKLERRVESLEQSLESAGKNVGYWVDKFMELKNDTSKVKSTNEHAQNENAHDEVRICGKCHTEQNMTKRIIGKEFCWWCPNCKDQISDSATQIVHNTNEVEDGS